MTVGLWRGPAQQRLHTREQLQHAERLGDIVVGTEAKAHDLVRFLTARRQDQDRLLKAFTA
jgi:hypothetical protein